VEAPVLVVGPLLGPGVLSPEGGTELVLFVEEVELVEGELDGSVDEPVGSVDAGVAVALADEETSVVAEAGSAPAP